jgi:hypothetical protein
LCVDSIIKKKERKSYFEDKDPPEYKDHINEIIDALENKLDFGLEKL